MDKILKIKDNYKRAFALGFKYIFENQAKMNKSDLAIAANLHPPVITHIINGYENNFPGRKAQNQLAKVLGTDIDHIVAIGERIQNNQHVGVNFLADKKPSHSDPDVQEFLEKFNLKDPYLEDLSTYEKEILKMCRSLEKNNEYLQAIYDFIGDVFVAYQAEKAKKLSKKK